MSKILLLGSGGHARVVLETLLQSYAPEQIGLIDPSKEVGTTIFGSAVLGGDEKLPELRTQGWTQAICGVGSVTSCELRVKLVQLLRELAYDMPAIIDQMATVSPFAQVGNGTYIGKRATVQPGAVIGQMCILNTGCIVEHDCQVGDFSHVSSGSVLLGGVCVGQETLIGAGSTVRQMQQIGSKVIVGAGSVVVSDLPDNSRAYGNPCRIRNEV